MKFNINDKVTVILTKKGVDTIKNYWEDAGMTPPREWKEGDRYEEQLWSIMAIFGKAIYLDGDVPFRTTIELNIDKPDEDSALLDQFAVSIIGGVVARIGIAEVSGSWIPRASYRLAKEMLEAREVHKEEHKIKNGEDL